MTKNDKSKQTKPTMANKNLIIDDSLFTKETPKYLSDFNDCYKIFYEKGANDILDEERLENGEKAAIIIADFFDFNRVEVKDKKNEYIKFARDVLYEAASKPNNSSTAMIHLIRALYGQTSIAYSQTQEHKVNNIKDGNEWVDHIERITDNKPLKAYALSLRAYQYIVNGEDLSMPLEERFTKAEKDLLYATKWIDDNYLGHYFLGLVYIDSDNVKYDANKALDNFNKAMSFKEVSSSLDEYVDKDFKNRVMQFTSNKIDAINAIL